MNVRILILLPALLLHNPVLPAGASAVSSLTNKILPNGDVLKLYLSATEENKAKLDELIKHLEEVQQRRQEFSLKIQSTLTTIKHELDDINTALHGTPDSDYLNKKASLLNDQYSTLKTIQLSFDKRTELLEQHIKVLQDYLYDPMLERFRRERGIDKTGAYLFEDLQSVEQFILEQERQLAQLQEQQENADDELRNRQRAYNATRDAYKEKQAAVTKPDWYEPRLNLLPAERAELVRVEEQLYANKQLHDEMRIKEIELKKDLIMTKLFATKLKRDILKKTARTIKPAIRVSEADIMRARDEFIKAKKKSFELKESFRQQAEAIASEQKLHEDGLQEAAKRYNITLAADIDDWSRPPKETPIGYRIYFEIAYGAERLQLLNRQRDLLEVRSAAEDEMLRYEGVRADVKESFHKVAARKFYSEEETLQELKKYDTPKAEADANLSLFKERKNKAEEQLIIQTRALKNIREFRKDVQSRKNTVFRGDSEDYVRCSELLNAAEKIVVLQLDVINKIIATYQETIAIASKTVKQIDFIRSEIGLASFWYRPEYAISWDGVQNILPDLQTFFVDVYRYVMEIEWARILYTVKNGLDKPYDVAFFIFACLVLLLLLLMGKRLLPALANKFVIFGQEYQGLYPVALLCAGLCAYLLRYYTWFAGWLVIYLTLGSIDFIDPYPFVLFYLCSIPYFIYLAYHCIEYIADFNEHNGYSIVGKEIQPRCTMIFSILLYVTIAIFFFRKAFILASYQKSELPIILAAAHLILLEISLIFLITKEHVLSIIPTSMAFGQWIYECIDRYFNLIMVIIISVVVLINRYIGFGGLVRYIFLRLLLTAGLLLLLVFIHRILRLMLAKLFFEDEKGVVKDRFTYGKTWYGVCILFMLVTFLFIGCIVIAHVWGWPEILASINDWSSLIELLRTPVMFKDALVPISALSLIQIIIAIVGGFLTSFLVNHFVLEKVFDALLVDAGVQNTVTSLMRYIIVIMAIMFGFQTAGLGYFVRYLVGALVLSIGWVVKDPIGDFVAYFIILVQRPVKIGDYISIEQDIEGVVRKITPRSVVLRRKNSTTIVLPNLSVINKPIVNWNYSRGFIAFNDILITIQYREDPALVKKLLMQVLEEHPLVLKTPRPIVRLDGFTDIGYLFMVRGFISSNYTLDQWDIASDIRLDIIRMLRTHSIRIAIPVRIRLEKDEPYTQYQQKAGEDRTNE